LSRLIECKFKKGLSRLKIKIWTTGKIKIRNVNMGREIQKLNQLIHNKN